MPDLSTYGMHQLPAYQPVDLSQIPTKARSFHQDQAAAEAEFEMLRDELADWQVRLYAEGKRKLLIVLQALDAGGKDGTIRRVFQGVNPQGVQVTSFKVPTAAELAHDFLWRVHQRVPSSGMMGVFNRSHYEDVLVVRVHQIVPESVWRPRYEQINQFEKLLADTGTTILKFYLHISKEEQRKRLQERLDDPRKHWKFSLDDLQKRTYWDDYMVAFSEMLNHCNTPYAPWYVIPADQKWYRNLAITRVLVGVLRQIAPQFPAPEDDLTGVVVT